MPLTNAQKQQRRRKKLDEVAREAGYDNHYQMMTAIGNREAIIMKSTWHPHARNYPIGSMWQATGAMHPDPQHAADEPFEARVHAHTVGAGPRRNQDAGVMFQVAADPTRYFEIKDALALDALRRIETELID